MKRIINASYCCADYNNGDSSSTWRQLEEQRQTCGYHILYFVLFAIESFISIMFMLRYIICFILVRQAPGKTIKCSTVRDLNNKTHSVAIDQITRMGKCSGRETFSWNPTWLRCCSSAVNQHLENRKRDIKQDIDPLVGRRGSNNCTVTQSSNYKSSSIHSRESISVFCHGNKYHICRNK